MLERPTTGVEERIAVCIERFESGGEAAVREYLDAHPDSRDEVESALAALLGRGLLEERREDSLLLPRRFGEFERRAHLGGGGMGVVYEAWQESLGRSVALKLIRPELAHSTLARERFRREIATLATLDHKGLIPIYASGETEGIAWFAMERIEGCTLGEALDRCRGRSPESLRAEDLQLTEESPGPGERDTRYAWSGFRTWPEACAAALLEVCTALQHAHERGVLHRDLKPSNIMLARDGRVLLFDFGLTLGQGSERLTRTGGSLGSPAYMAPEQIRGSNVDERTDVYGLGVTLYEMLTLRLPFLGTGEHDLASKILDSTPVPPRHRNAAILWELETICLVAMDRDPARRYASVQDFAEDLRRCLAKQPIHARRPGPLLRLRRWTQRSPGLALSLLLAVLLLFGAPTALWLQQRQANRLVRIERDHARRNLRIANTAVDHLLTGLGGVEFNDLPELGDFALGLIEKAVTSYAEALREASDTDALVLEEAKARHLLAVVLANRGQLAASQREFESAYARLRSHAESLEIVPWGVVLTLAQFEASLAKLWQDDGKLVEARAILARARERIEDRQGEGTPPRAAKWILVACAKRAGDLHEAECAPHRALASFLRAVGLARPLVTSRSAPARVLQFVQCLAEAARLSAILDEGDVSEAQLEEGLELVDGLLRTNPRSKRFRETKARALSVLGMRHFRARDCEAAITRLTQSLHLFQEIERDFPDEPRLRSRTALAWSRLAEAQAELRKYREALQSFEKAAQHFGAPEGRPLRQFTEFLSYLVHVRTHGEFLARARRFPAAKERLDEAYALLQKLPPAWGSQPVYLKLLATLHNLRSIVERRSGNHAAAESAARDAIATCDVVLRAKDDPALRQQRLRAEHSLAAALLSQQKHDEAIATYERVIAEKRRLLESDSNRNYARLSLARSLHNLAGIRLERRETERAAALLQEAVRFSGSAHEEVPNHAGYLRQLRNSREALAWCHLRLGDAKAAFTQATGLAQLAGGSANELLRAAKLGMRADSLAAGASGNEWRQQVLEWLRGAVANGLSDPQALEDSGHLSPLRSEPGFRKLVQELRERH